ncbi:MAG: VOC family protein [Pseudomonadota bacterium]
MRPALDHVHVWVRDRAAAAAWYARVLHLRPAETFAAWADGGPLFLQTPAGDPALALFEGESARGADHTVAFRVSAEDFRAFVAALPTLDLRDRTGAAVTAGSIVDHGLAVSLYFTDPEGNRLELTCYDVAALGDLLDRPGRAP